jgi:hypothetical protein
MVGRTTVRSSATAIGRGLKPLDDRTDPRTKLGGLNNQTPVVKKNLLKKKYSVKMQKRY